MVQMNDNIVGIDAAIFMHPTTWKASGHVDAFNDPLIDNKDSKKRYRADVLIEDHMAKIDDKINKEVENGPMGAFLKLSENDYPGGEDYGDIPNGRDIEVDADDYEKQQDWSD
jgi:glycyl-tRNA synthetase (class II)